jgi:hypothetical protein
MIQRTDELCQLFHPLRFMLHGLDDPIQEIIRAIHMQAV